MTIPKALRGRVQRILTIEEVRQRIAFDRAVDGLIDPPRKRIDQDEFEEKFYAWVAKEPETGRDVIFSRMRRLYLIA